MTCPRARGIFSILTFYISTFRDAVHKISLHDIFMQFYICLVIIIQDYLDSYNTGNITEPLGNGPILPLPFLKLRKYAVSERLSNP